MRVAFVSMFTTDHRDTPAFRRARHVAEALASRGHDVVWLGAQWWEGRTDQFDYEGVNYRAVTDSPSSGAFRSKLPFALRKANPEVIHAVNVPPTHVSTAKTTGRLLRTPVVVDWWEQDLQIGSRKQYRKAASRSDAVFTPSETVRTGVREHGASDEDVHVIPESVDFDLVREAPVEDTFDVVYARDLDDGANVEAFLLGLAELRDRDWTAAVIGDGPARRDAERAARDLRIEDRVVFLGDLPPERFVPLLKGTHVFAQTATYEPFATKLLWALACGCVGIVEYQAGSSAHELVEGLDRGRLVTSPQELADEIVACGGMETMSVNGEFAGFDHDAMLGEYVDRYNDVIDNYGLF